MIDYIPRVLLITNHFPLYRSTSRSTDESHFFPCKNLVGDVLGFYLQLLGGAVPLISVHGYTLWAA